MNKISDTRTLLEREHYECIQHIVAMVRAGACHDEVVYEICNLLDVQLWTQEGDEVSLDVLDAQSLTRGLISPVNPTESLIIRVFLLAHHLSKEQS